MTRKCNAKTKRVVVNEGVRGVPVHPTKHQGAVTRQLLTREYNVKVFSWYKDSGERGACNSRVSSEAVTYLPMHPLKRCMR